MNPRPPAPTPAVAILPYRYRPRRRLADVPLEDLAWPLGRPERLTSGVVADLGPEDHLLTYPRTPAWIERRGPVQARVSLMIVEPDAIHAKHLRLARLLHWRFHRILTKSHDLLRSVPNARKFVFGWSSINQPQEVATKKSKSCSLIASSKTDQEGHRLRHRVVGAIRAANLDVDVMGRGYRPFDAKEDGLAPYRFSVVIENVREPSYLTEKLLDCLICRTVPIYWGAPDIGEYFDTSSMIVCDSEQDILSALGDVSDARYRMLSGAVEKNRERALGLARTEERAARLLLTD